MEDQTKVNTMFGAMLLAPGAIVLVIAKTAGASWLLASTLGAGAVAAVAAAYGKKPEA